MGAMDGSLLVALLVVVELELMQMYLPLMEVL